MFQKDFQSYFQAMIAMIFYFNIFKYIICQYIISYAIVGDAINEFLAFHRKNVLVMITYHVE
ncbi:hypothetical protein [Clostridium sp. KNHs214]|uniref:hypothetical protein n=1 Tax=Clostridium sp. KNHs214 TaxID=1540257 RepID=UPI00163AD6D7|nr:hypothetical protein [Clostridium sp. KNHs214]